MVRCLPQSLGSQCQAPALGGEWRGVRLWEPRYWYCQTSVPCTTPPPLVMLPALSPCLPLTFAKREDWIIPPGLDIDIEINLKGVRFPCLFTKVSITHIATHTCPVTAITNEVIRNNFSEIDLGGLIWGPNHLL